MRHDGRMTPDTAAVQFLGPAPSTWIVRGGLVAVALFCVGLMGWAVGHASPADSGASYAVLAGIAVTCLVLVGLSFRTRIRLDAWGITAHKLISQRRVAWAEIAYIDGNTSIRAHRHDGDAILLAQCGVLPNDHSWSIRTVSALQRRLERSRAAGRLPG